MVCRWAHTDPKLGTYVLKEDLHLATPPPHPSESTVVNVNPLSTNPQPATAGTRVTLLTLDTRSTPFFYKGLSATTLALSGAPSSIQEHPNEGRYSTEGGLSSEDGRAASGSDVPGTSITWGSAPAFGGGNNLLAQVQSKDVNKKKKPKNNMTKSNSSFISRVIVHETLSKKLTERPSDGVFAFANINRAFQWLDMSSTTKVCCKEMVLMSFGGLTCRTARLHDQDFIYESALLMP